MSPAQRFLGHRCKTLLPMPHSHPEPHYPIYSWQYTSTDGLEGETAKPLQLQCHARTLRDSCYTQSTVLTEYWVKCGHSTSQWWCMWDCRATMDTQRPSEPESPPLSSAPTLVKQECCTCTSQLPYWSWRVHKPPDWITNYHMPYRLASIKLDKM